MIEQSVSKSFPWINSDFVQKVVRYSEADECVVLNSFDAKLAFKSGENFSSHMVALRATFKNKTKGIEKQKYFLVKISLQTEEFTKMCQECHVYEREIEAYTKVLPALEKCFNKLGISGRIAPMYLFLFKILSHNNTIH